MRNRVLHVETLNHIISVYLYIYVYVEVCVTAFCRIKGVDYNNSGNSFEDEV